MEKEHTLITTFPIPYPDEIFYGILARYSTRMNYSYKSTLAAELFGRDGTTGAFDLPNGLRHLVGNLMPHPRLTVGNFIINHTTLNFYRPFMSALRFNNLQTEIEIGTDKSIFLRPGHKAIFTGRPAFLRYCPVCVIEDRNIHGEAYWHRIHQLPGMTVCCTHHVWLEPSTVKTTNTATSPSIELVCAEDVLANVVARQADTSDDIASRLLILGEDLTWVLSHADQHLESETLRQSLIYALRKADLASYRGRTRPAEILQHFNEHCLPEVQELVGCNQDASVWIKNMLYEKDATLSPIHFLLLIRSLGYSARSLFELADTDKPFGPGPWPCLNPACSNFGKLSIHSHIVSYNAYGEPRGTFACECGFVYTRVGPDSVPEDTNKYDSINARGQEWENRLRTLWADETVQLRDIERELKTSAKVAKALLRDLGCRFHVPMRIHFSGTIWKLPNLNP